MYNKLFSKIVDSSIWLAPDPVRIVWITFLALMDEDGMVQLATVANVAHRARVDLAAAEQAVKQLESPEPSTATDDDDGRRIERVPGGWLVLNAKKYRDMATRAISRESTRLRVARYRAKKAGNGDVTGSNGDVAAPSRSVTQSDTEADTEAEAERPTTVTSTSQGSSADAKDATARRDQEPAFEMPADWSPNEINCEWLTESGMSNTRVQEIVAEFVTWARHSGIRRNAKNWQLTFYRNPRVKSAVGSARTHKGKANGARQQGSETAYERAGRRLREWAERTGVDPKVLKRG